MITGHLTNTCWAEDDDDDPVESLPYQNKHEISFSVSETYS